MNLKLKKDILENKNRRFKETLFLINFTGLMNLKIVILERNVSIRGKSEKWKKVSSIF